MEEIKKIIGENLQKIRNNGGMSLQQLADLTGVSKTMLGALERGEINPTIGTLWKISGGLKMPLSRLINKESKDVVIARADAYEYTLDQGGIKLLSIFKFDPKKRIEVFLKHFDEGSMLESDGHSAGVEEYLMVFEGEMEIEVNGERFRLMPGDSVKFVADGPHKYWNIGAGPVKAYTIFYYPDKAGF